MAYFGKILRNYADHSFGTITEYGRQLNGIPRAKHAFVVEFLTTLQGAKSKPWREMLKGLSTIVQSCDLPSFVFNTQTLNQYNRKRIIQTKVEWNPITIRFYDTRDNKFQNVMDEYFKWYYKDGRGTDEGFRAGGWVSDVVDENPNIDKFGYQAPLTEDVKTKTKFEVPAPDASNTGEPRVNFEKYFFSKIIINRMAGGREAPIKAPIILYNPTITSIQHDNLDYSSAQPISWSVQFAYEGVQHASQDKVPDGGPDWISRGADAAGEWYDSWGSQDGPPKGAETKKDGSKFIPDLT
jgi:hypothetical protein